MSIPSVQELALPVLKVLSGGKSLSTRVITQSLAEEFGLSAADLGRTRADGRPLFKNRIEWARTRLKKQGLVEYPEPCATKITDKGLRLLEADPRQFGDAFLASTPEPPLGQLRFEDATCVETLEQELRRLTGPTAADIGDWEIIRRLNGWGPEAPVTYRRLASQLGTDTDSILRVARKCKRPTPEEAPMLDAALRLVLDRPERDPDSLALELVTLGITSDAFCLQGLAEAARRFGRFEQWRELIRLLAKHQPRTARPRPFDSWFEVDVFLFLVDLGHRVIPQKRIGNYRVDLLLPDFIPQLVVECDGDRFHTLERAKQDEAREQWLGERGYSVLRFKYSDYKARPGVIQRGLAETLASPQTVGLQTRAG